MSVPPESWIEPLLRNRLRMVVRNDTISRSWSCGLVQALVSESQKSAKAAEIDMVSPYGWRLRDAVLSLQGAPGVKRSGLRVRSVRFGLGARERRLVALGRELRLGGWSHRLLERESSSILHH